MRTARLTTLALGFTLLISTPPHLRAEQTATPASPLPPPALEVDSAAESGPWLTWQTVLTLALEHNTELLVAQEQIQTVEGRILSAKANFMPRVNMGAFPLPPTVVAGLTVPVFTAARAPTYRSIPIGRAAARTNVQLTLLETVFKLRIAYHRAYFAQEISRLNQQRLALIEERVRRAPALFELGRLKKSDLLALEVRAENTRSEAQRADLRAELEMLTLLEIIGLPPSDPRLAGRLADDFAQQELPAVPLDQLREFAMQERLDLQLLRYLSQFAREEVRIAAAAAYPTAGIGASVFKEFLTPKELRFLIRALDPQSAQQDEDDNDIRGGRASFVASGSWRVVDWGEVAGRVQAAEAGVRVQEETIAQLTREIPRQVTLAYLNAQSAELLYSKLRETPLPRQNYETALRSYEAGQLSQLEILDAQEELINAQQNLVTLRLGRDISLANLDRALGRFVKIQDTLP